MPATSRLWALSSDSAQGILTELALQLRPRENYALPASENSLPQNSGDKKYSVQNGVAIIGVSGTITRSTMYSFWSGQAISQGQDEILKDLNSALADHAVKAILLNINSPGGTVPGTKELADSIEAAAKVKPMAAYANGLMASAAMWIGAATGLVMAPVTATVGSIGVIWVHEDFSRLNEKCGISHSYITGGKFKAAGNPDNPLTDEERAYFQKQVSQIHKIFKVDVARNLGIKVPEANWAEGQTMLAEDAKAAGLVTHIVRDLSSAITLLANLASTEGKMDYATLAAQHPELLAEITGKARAEAAQTAQAAIADAQAACAGAQATAKTSAEQTRADLMAMLKNIAGEEVCAKLNQLISAGITPAQMEALAPFMAQSATQTVQPGQSAAEEKAKAEILAGLHAVTPGVLSPGQLPSSTIGGAGNAENNGKSKLMADAERRAVKA